MAKDRYLLGLDIGASAVKACLFKSSRRGALQLAALDVEPLSSSAVVEGELLNAGEVVSAVSELIKRNKIKVKECAMMVTGYSVIIKRIALPTMTRQELETEIYHEAAPYIPFEVQDVYLDVHKLRDREAQGQMDVLLIAAKKDVVNSFASVSRDAGLEPMVMDTNAFALQNIYEHNYGESRDDTVVLVDVGAVWTNVSVLSEGTTAYTRDLLVAGNAITEEIQKQLGVAFEQAEDMKLGLTGELDVDVPGEVDGIVSRACDRIAAEVQRCLDFYASTASDSMFTRMMLTGGSARLPHLVEALEQTCGMEVELLNPLAQVALDSPSKLSPVLEHKMAVAAGLALRRSDET